MKREITGGLMTAVFFIGVIVWYMWVTVIPTAEKIDGNVDYRVTEGKVVKMASNSALNEYYITIQKGDNNGSIIKEVLQISKVEYDNTVLLESVKRSDYDN